MHGDEMPAVLIVMASFAGVVAVAYYAFRVELLSRGRNRAIAIDLFEIHREYLTEICGDDRTPLSIKELSLALSQNLQNEGWVRKIADDFLSKSRENSPLRDDILNDLNVMAANSPELLQGFAGLIKSGLMAAFLRWPSTSADARRLSYIMAAKPDREEIGAVVRASRDFKGLVPGSSAFA
jgi:hypothetical protein